jgi:small ligand-binding sensory domain FIST
MDSLAEALGGAPELTVVFASPHRAADLERLANLDVPGTLIGVTGEAVVGPGREIEGSAALAIWAVRLPQDVALKPFRIEAGARPAGDRASESRSDGAVPAAVLLLGDPFSFAADAWLAHWNQLWRGVPVLGGMASAARRPGENRLVLNREVFSDGAVGIELGGPVPVRAVVSQGCRPIGRTLLVTRAEGNLIRELGRRPALEVLQEIVADLDESDRELLRHGLHLGRVIDEYRESFGRGDFLVRNILGITEDGAIVVGEPIRVGQTVQFHVRDADSADQDLRALLTRAMAEGDRPSGALLFSCNGRGTRMFPVPDHDVTTIGEVVGDIPVAGFFAMGEFGPVSGQNFVHGFTASVALFGF